MTRRTGAGRAALLAWATICMAVVAGLGLYVAYGPPSKLTRLPAADPAATPPPNEAPNEAPKGTVSVPVPKADGSGISWEDKPVPAQSGDKVQDAVNAFLSLSKIAPGARVVKVAYERDNVRLDTVNLFERGYGTDDEKTLLEGILRAVAANSKALTVTFFENGNPVGALGNREIEGPISVR